MPARSESSRLALERLDEAVYVELKRIASRVARRTPHSTLNTTALLHEAWLKLRKASRLEIGSREHFVALVIKALREAATDAARRRLARKRNAGSPVEIPLDDLPIRQAEAETLLAVHEALSALAQDDERAARVMEARYFGRLSVQEIADEFRLSVSSVERGLAFGKAWLARWLGERQAHDA